MIKEVSYKISFELLNNSFQDSIRSGNLLEANVILKTMFEKILKYNFLNHLNKSDSLRKTYFPNDLDLLFLAIKIYEKNYNLSKMLEASEEARELISRNFRKLSKGKNKNEYTEELLKLCSLRRYQYGGIYKLFLNLKEKLNKKEVLEYLILNSESLSSVKTSLNKFSPFEKELSEYLNIKNVQKTGIKENSKIERLDEIPSTKTKEKKQINIPKTYVLSDEEKKLIVLIKNDYFNDEKNIADLIYGFGQLEFYKASEALVEKYANNENRLILAEMYLAGHFFTEAKYHALQVLSSRDAEVGLRDWAMRILNYE